jgi:hypothetical protein
MHKLELEIAAGSRKKRSIAYQVVLGSRSTGTLQVKTVSAPLPPVSTHSTAAGDKAATAGCQQAQTLDSFWLQPPAVCALLSVSIPNQKLRSFR